MSRNLVPMVLSHSSQRARRTANLALPRVHWTIENIRGGGGVLRFRCFFFSFFYPSAPCSFSSNLAPKDTNPFCLKKMKNTKQNKQTKKQFQWLESLSALEGTFQLVLPSQFLLFPFLLKTLIFHQTSLLGNLTVLKRQSPRIGCPTMQTGRTIHRLARHKPGSFIIVFQN